MRRDLMLTTPEFRAELIDVLTQMCRTVLLNERGSNGHPICDLPRALWLEALTPPRERHKKYSVHSGQFQSSRAMAIAEEGIDKSMADG